MGFNKNLLFTDRGSLENWKVEIYLETTGKKEEQLG